MISLLSAWLVLVTIGGTYLILAVLGIPWSRLFEAESRAWEIARIVACSLPMVAAQVRLLTDFRPFGEALINWAFFPFGAWLWARCLYLAIGRLRSRA